MAQKHWLQEWPGQTKPKKGQFVNFSRGHSGTKIHVNRACFPKENTRIHTNGRNSYELFVLALSLVWFAGATPEECDYTNSCLESYFCCHATIAITWIIALQSIYGNNLVDHGIAYMKVLWWRSHFPDRSYILMYKRFLAIVLSLADIWAFMASLEDSKAKFSGNSLVLMCSKDCHAAAPWTSKALVKSVHTRCMIYKRCL